ncbi:SseB family protein [Actinokineospora iranica]|uniref:SseB protein N-terminal domain-containing protein n=1 Tax=Actinokineospora iranica TaxID=1271860 RepID=A0A1G6M9M9_9PSEU|nr:SseB family protein [Actinokineospora iranica]SDC51645.1 hypothetical protein SAMN05216174_102418 [Actinokineospora iranica]
MAVPVEEKLHKGPGVRRPDLTEFLTEPFAARMHVFDDDPAEVVLAKVVWQVSAVVRRVTRDPKWITVLEAMYNLPRDPELTPLGLTGRLTLLRRRHGTGWDTSTTNTRLSELRRNHLFGQLKGKFPWPPEHEIEPLARLEAEYASLRNGTGGHQTYLLPESAFGKLIAGRNGAGRGEVDHALLAQATLHFAVSARGNLVTTTTADFGENLPVFTDAGLLREYLAAVRAPASDVPADAPGRKILDILVSAGRIGLVVNPLGGHGAHVGQHWSPADLARLARR